MSGYWESPVNYARVAEQIGEATKMQREIEQSAASLADTAKRIGQAIAAENVGTHELKARITDLLARIGPLTTAIGGARRSGSAVVIPGRAVDTTEGAMSGVVSQLRSSETQLAGARKGLEDLSREFAEVTLQDAALVGSRVALFAADEMMRSHGAAIDKWFPSEAKPLSAQIGQGLRDVAACSVEQDPVRIRQLDQRVGELEKRAEDLVARAEELEDSQQKRMYTLKGLREVCARLGFDEVQAPQYEHGQPSDRVVFAVDTRGRGKIAFRLGLDDRIETDSKMDSQHCSQQFSKLAESLAEQFGIQAQFTDMHVAPRPDLKTWDAKDLPQGRRESAAEN